MRDVLVFASLVTLSVACGSDPPAGEPPRLGTTKSAIIGGDLDPGDPSVIELFYVVGFAPSACAGNATCLQTCLDTTGQACASGPTCRCGTSAGCTGELIGPHTVVTAGHCTDLVAGGTLSGKGDPALTPCTSSTDVTTLLSGMPPSSGCNIAVLALFNNKCTTNDLMSSCEGSLIQYGDYILADQVINPGYDASALPPYSATSNDNDIGLVHLTSTTLVNGGAEPGILVFNRSDLGAPCTDLGPVKSVGYGLTQPSQGANALAGLKYAVTSDARVKDAWHIEEDGAQSYPAQTCGAGVGLEPTCEGDSGGPAFDSAGHIVGVTSLGDPDCSAYGESTRIDAYAAWIDTTMASWGDPQNGAVAPVDSGATPACDACADTDTGAPSTTEAGAPIASAEASTDEAEGGTGGSAGALSIQSKASGGCSVVVATPDRRPAGALAPLLLMATAFARRRTKR